MNGMLLMSGAALLLTAAQARAVTIIPDFSKLGTVYQDSTNQAPVVLSQLTLCSRNF